MAAPLDLLGINRPDVEMLHWSLVLEDPEKVGAFLWVQSLERASGWWTHSSWLRNVLGFWSFPGYTSSFPLVMGAALSLRTNSPES